MAKTDNIHFLKGLLSIIFFWLVTIVISQKTVRPSVLILGELRRSWFLIIDFGLQGGLTGVFIGWLAKETRLAVSIYYAVALQAIVFLGPATFLGSHIKEGELIIAPAAFAIELAIMFLCSYGVASVHPNRNGTSDESKGVYPKAEMTHRKERGND
jgi:hypothetical protein